MSQWVHPTIQNYSVWSQEKKKEVPNLRVENKFRTFEEMQIPYCDNTVRFIQGCWIFVIWGDTELRILTTRSKDGTLGVYTYRYLRRPINVCYRPVFHISLIPEFTHLLDTLSFRVIAVFEIRGNQKSKISLTLQIQYRFCNHECNHNRRSEPFAQSLKIVQQIQGIPGQPKY